MSATGRCLCGAVTYEARDIRTEFRACQCATCRRWTSGPLFAVHVGDLTFGPEAPIQVYDSSSWAERGFCRECGTSLFYRLKSTGQHEVSLGTFDDPSPYQLVGEIFVDGSPEACRLAGDHPRLTAKEFLATLGIDEDTGSDS